MNEKRNRLIINLDCIKKARIYINAYHDENGYPQFVKDCLISMAIISYGKLFTSGEGSSKNEIAKNKSLEFNEFLQFRLNKNYDSPSNIEILQSHNNFKHWRDKVIAHSSGNDHRVLHYKSPNEYYLTRTGFPDVFGYSQKLITQMEEYIQELIDS